MGILAGLLGRNSKRELGSAMYGPRARKAMRLVGGIDAARIDRFAETWTGTPVTPDEMIRLWHRILQARSRDMAVNDPYMRNFVRRARVNIIGHGPHLKCAVKMSSGQRDDIKTNAAVMQSWQEWKGAENCDVTGTETFRSLELTAQNALTIDGEVFVKIVSGGPFGIQLQLIDAVRCPVDYDISGDGKGTYIRSGVEFDQNDRPVAYYFSTDDNNGDYYQFAGRKFHRVPADEVLHIFRKEFIGQKRGLPWAMAALFRLKRLRGFEDNAAMNAEVGAGKMGIISWDADAGPERPDDQGEIRITAEGGTFVELPSGAHLDKWDPSFPDAAVTSFTKALLRGAGAGMGVMYPGLGNDLEGVNFSSIRAGALDERELWKEDQRLIIEGFHLPVFRRWVAAALLRGMVVSDDGYVAPATKLRAIVRNSAFHGRRWEWVDPKSDAAANRMAVENLVKSPQEIIRERGRDPTEIIQEIAQWYRDLKANGVPETVIAMASGQQFKVMIDENPDGTAASGGNETK